MRKALKTCSVLALCAALLTTAAAAAGGAEDPLVSLSYVRDQFLPAITSVFSERASRAAAEREAEHALIPERMRLWELAEGESLRLEEGQQMLVLSGSALLQVESGEVVNASEGRTALGGTLRTNNRYIVCEESAASAVAAGSVTLWADSDAVKTTPQPGEQPGEDPAELPGEDPEDPEAPPARPVFLDVPEDAWFYEDVYRAVERGLVNGMSADSYAPGGSLTAAQCVKLAACMHQLYAQGAVTLAPASEGDWYAPYADYAREQGILKTDYADYDAVLDRRDFVALFYRALPESEYPAINDVETVPDLSPEDAQFGEVLCLYRAGILSGYTNTPGFSEHAFGPESSITRAEVAAIMNRMFDAAARVSFTV